MTHQSFAHDHDLNCDWHIDQVEAECNCGGISGVIPPGFVPASIVTKNLLSKIGYLMLERGEIRKICQETHKGKERAYTALSMIHTLVNRG